MIGFLKFIFIIVIVVLGFSFYQQNPDLITIKYYLGEIEVAKSLVVIFSLIVGALLGMIASLGMVIPLMREKSKLNKAVKAAELEVSNLRSIPLKDAD
ncbi:MAG: LapA family protein [Gammaproteobacteria bacterium]